jgi:hypothetical protein
MVVEPMQRELGVIVLERSELLLNIALAIVGRKKNRHP